MDAASANAAIETIRLIAHLLQNEEQGAHPNQRPIPGIEENHPAPVGAAEGCDLLILSFENRIKGSQPSAAPTGDFVG
jgi:hypothetical protein